MRRTLCIVTTVLLLAAAALVGCSGGTTTPASTVPAPAPTTSSETTSGAATAVSIANFAFSPATVTIKVGDSVTWTNNDSAAHTVTGTGFDSGQVAPGAAFTQKFDKAGSFDYSCSIHPSMTGKVTVQ